MQGFGKKYRKPSGARMIFSTNPKGWPCLYGKNTNYLCLWLWGLGYGMLVFPDMFLFRKIAAVYMAFSERNVIFAGEIKSYLKA